MFTLRFAFKNIISRKSSLVIVLFIAFSIAILVMANAIFDGTGTGIEKTFSSNFTGDIVIRPKADFPMSLFGDETPATGSLSELPQLVPYPELIKLLEDTPEIESYVSQVTSQGVIKANDESTTGVLFGVDAEDYVKIMDGIKIISGSPYKEGEKGIMLSTSMIENLQSDDKAPLQVGDSIQLLFSNGASPSIREAPLSAIYEYTVQNDLQGKIILVDPDTLRSLTDIKNFSALEATIDDANSFLIDDFDSIDDMFSDDAGLLFEEDGESEVAETAEPVVEEVFTEAEIESASWHYVICKSQNASAGIKKLNRTFAKNEWNIQAINWRTAAGMSAQYLYWMRLIFNIGIIIIIGTGFIVVNNTLVIAAMDRTKETGAVRAIGASRSFIAVEYLLETAMLTITAGIVGCILGVIGNAVLCSFNITISNTYLIQLFGGTTLSTSVTLSNIGSCMVLSVLLAIVGWFYPVHIALETSPVVAMEGVR
jgi:putative ABC transport system permease protein